MNNLPKISIITYVYVNAINGREKLFKECLESIAIQNYPNYEHIIIDDGSDIDIKPLVDSFPNTRYLRKDGSGILSSTFTYNLGMKITDAKYSVLLPSDDTQIEGALLGLVKEIELNSSASMIIGKAVNEYSNGDKIIWEPNKHNIENKLGDANYINGCAVMWKNTSHLLELLPPNYVGFCSDYDHWCTLSKLGDIVYSSIKVVKYRQADDSTRNKTRSRFITSPRCQDSVFFQYSKNTRLEFVKDRYKLSINEMKRDLNIPYSVEIDLKNVEMNENNMQFFEKRNWNKLHDLLLKNKDYKKNYELLKSKIKKEKKIVILIKDINFASLIIMQILKYEAFFIVKSDFIENEWKYEFLPIPSINKILDKNNKLNTNLMKYLGLNV